MGILDFLAKATTTEQDRQVGIQASALGRTGATAAWCAEKISRDIEAARLKQNPEESAAPEPINLNAGRKSVGWLREPAPLPVASFADEFQHPDVKGCAQNAEMA